MHTSADIKLYILKNKLYIDGLEKREETLPSRRESEYLGMYSFKVNPRLQNFRLFYNMANFYQYQGPWKRFKEFFRKIIKDVPKEKKSWNFENYFSNFRVSVKIVRCYIVVYKNGKGCKIRLFLVVCKKPKLNCTVKISSQIRYLAVLTDYNHNFNQ